MVWEITAVGTYHQARQFDIVLPAGGGGAGHGAQSSGMAQPMLSPHDAARAKDRQGCYGAAVGYLSVLDDAPGDGTISSGLSSVRTRGSPDIVMVWSRTPSY